MFEIRRMVGRTNWRRQDTPERLLTEPVGTLSRCPVHGLGFPLLVIQRTLPTLVPALAR